MKKDLNIIVVDDNYDHVKIMAWALEQSEIKVKITVINDGKKAVEVFESLGETGNLIKRNPDLIFLDINLPGMNGINVLQHIRKSPKLHMIPVIMVSSSDRTEDVQAAYANGANSYLCKANVFNEVAQMMNNVCKYWANIAQLPSQP